MVSITLEISDEFINKVADASINEYLKITGEENPMILAMEKHVFLKLQDSIKENKEQMLFINSDNLDDEHAKIFIANVTECYMLSDLINKYKTKDDCE